MFALKKAIMRSSGDTILYQYSFWKHCGILVENISQIGNLPQTRVNITPPETNSKFASENQSDWKMIHFFFGALLLLSIFSGANLLLVSGRTKHLSKDPPTIDLYQKSTREGSTDYTDYRSDSSEFRAEIFWQAIVSLANVPKTSSEKVPGGNSKLFWNVWSDYLLDTSYKLAKDTPR